MILGTKCMILGSSLNIRQTTAKIPEIRFYFQNYHNYMLNFGFNFQFGRFFERTLITALLTLAINI